MIASESEPRIVDSACRTSSRLTSLPAASAHFSGEPGSGWSRRIFSSLEIVNGYFLPILERYWFKRTQYAAFQTAWTVFSARIVYQHLGPMALAHSVPRPAYQWIGFTPA
jgi:hypothetical protein